MFSCYFVYDLFDIFSCSPRKRKCHSDTLFIMFEAHRHYGEYGKNVIKSYTFQGYFLGGVLKWILSRFFIVFGLILEGLGIPKVAKQLCKVTFSAMVSKRFFG